MTKNEKMTPQKMTNHYFNRNCFFEFLKSYLNEIIHWPSFSVEKLYQLSFTHVKFLRVEGKERHSFCTLFLIAHKACIS